MNKRVASVYLESGMVAKKQRGFMTPATLQDADVLLPLATQGARIAIEEPYRLIPVSRAQEKWRGHLKQLRSINSHGNDCPGGSSVTMSPHRPKHISSHSFNDQSLDMDITGTEICDLSDSFAKFHTQWNGSVEEEVAKPDMETSSNTSEVSATSSVQIILSKDVTMSRGSPSRKDHQEKVVSDIEDEYSSTAETEMDIVEDDVEHDDMPAFADSLGVEMFNVAVGPTAHLFRLHKTRLVLMVPWFECNAKGPLTLRYDTPQAFSLLVQWIYTGGIPTPANIDPHLDPVSHIVQRNIFLDAYILGCRVNSIHFMDLIATVYIDTFIPNAAELNAFLDKIPRMAPLRNFGIMYINYALSQTQSVTDYISRSELEKMLAKNPHLAEECSGERAFQYVAVDPRSLPRCEFHGHAYRESCSLGREMNHC